MKLTKYNWHYIIGLLAVCLGFTSICSGVEFTFEELIYDGVNLSPNVPMQGMDMHSCYDGQYIWYPEHNFFDHNNNLIRLNPDDDSIDVYPLAGYGSDRVPIVYHAICDLLDSNSIWVWAAYGTHSLWKFNKTSKDSIYISGKGKVAGAGYGGKITRFTQSDGTSRIWGSLVWGSTPVAYDEYTDTFTHYTLHTDIPGVIGSTIGIYGMQSDEKNLFICNASEGTGYIYAIHNNFTTNGKVTLSGSIQATYIKSSDVVSYTTGEGESYTDLAWDGTYLWTSGGDATSNKIYRIQPAFDDEGYVTSFGEATIYDTGNGWVSLAPSIKANDKYVMAVWEASGKFGGLLIDRTNNFAIWNFVGDDENIYPFVEEYWNTVTVEIDAPGAIYITGYYPYPETPNKSMHILKMMPNLPTVIDSDSDSIPDSEDNCPNKPNGPILGTCLLGSAEAGSTCTSDADCVIGCSSNGSCSKNQEDTDADGVGDVCDIDSSIRALVREYYLDILGREPDAGGWDYWTDEIKRIVSLGIYVGEGFQAQARFFFNSSEYLSKSTSDTVFVTDMYHTFLQREPDAAGLAYWVGELSCLTRNMLITQFAYSNEFKQFMTDTFGADTTRPENNLINDLYRGFLNRFPDDEGFNDYVTQMRTAQCTGAEAVRNLSYQIALSFVQSAEYAARSRDNTGYVEDLYNGILRRGGDCAGFAAWVSDLDGGANRVSVLKSFTDSTEFQTRVDAVIAAGCLP